MRVGWWTVLGIAVLVTTLCVLLVAAAIRNDRAIENNLGRADAEVISVAFDRTIVRFETPDGAVQIPQNGVLYPDGLSMGQLVRVEYDTSDPTVTKVAGRSWVLMLLPLGTTVVITWLIGGPLLWWVRRRTRRLALEPAA